MTTTPTPEAAAPAAPTYKHPDSGRYYRTMAPRATGLPVTVGHGDDLDLGVADDGAWWTVCDEHGWAYSWPTQIAARYGCATPLAWCPTCQDVANDNGGGAK